MLDMYQYGTVQYESIEPQNINFNDKKDVFLSFWRPFRWNGKKKKKKKSAQTGKTANKRLNGYRF